jgi:antitoxin (DNA-binding transcriptional repressor) of toxin-antitoxin stability system
MQHSGEPVIICRHGKAIAELIPLRRGGRTRPDKRLLRIKIKQDPTLPTTSEWEDA